MKIGRFVLRVSTTNEQDSPLDDKAPSRSQTASKESAPENKSSSQTDKGHPSPTDEEIEEEPPTKGTLKSRLGGKKSSPVQEMIDAEDEEDEEDEEEKEESPKQSTLKSRVGRK